MIKAKDVTPIYFNEGYLICVNGYHIRCDNCEPTGSGDMKIWSVCDGCKEVEVPEEAVLNLIRNYKEKEAKK